MKTRTKARTTGLAEQERGRSQGREKSGPRRLTDGGRIGAARLGVALGLALGLGLTGDAAAMQKQHRSTCEDTGIVDAEKPWDRIQPSKASACLAASGQELLDHVNDPTCATIVLTSQDYELPATHFSPYLRIQRPIEIWGTGAATTRLRFGVEFRPSIGVPGASGSALRGVTVQPVPGALPSSPGTAVPIPNSPFVNGAAIVGWEPSDPLAGDLRDITLEDVRVEGGGWLGVGIQGTAPRGAHLRRVEVNHVTQFGVNVRNIRAAQLNVVDRAILEDIRVEGVNDTACFLDDPELCPFPGSHQIGIWIGASHTQLSRAWVRDVFWTGIATGRVIHDVPYVVSGASLRDLDVDGVGTSANGFDAGRGPGVGIYFERILRDSTLTRFCVGPNTERGVNVEWNKNEVGLGSGRFRVTNGWIASTYYAVGFDAGTFGAYVGDIAVENAQWTALLFPSNWEQFPNPGVNSTSWDGVSVAVPVCAPGASHPAASPCTCVVSFSSYDPTGPRFCEVP